MNNQREDQNEQLNYKQANDVHNYVHVPKIQDQHRIERTNLLNHKFARTEFLVESNSNTKIVTFVRLCQSLNLQRYIH